MTKPLCHPNDPDELAIVVTVDQDALGEAVPVNVPLWGTIVGYRCWCSKDKTNVASVAPRVRTHKSTELDDGSVILALQASTTTPKLADVEPFRAYACDGRIWVVANAAHSSNEATFTHELRILPYRWPTG